MISIIYIIFDSFVKDKLPAAISCWNRHYRASNPKIYRFARLIFSLPSLICNPKSQMKRGVVLI